MAAAIQVDWGDVYESQRPHLISLASRFVGLSHAEDAVHDAFLQAMLANSFRGDSAISTWLHRIVVNRCLQIVRKKRWNTEDLLPNEKFNLRTSAEPSAHDKFWQKQQLALAEDVLFDGSFRTDYLDSFFLYCEGCTIAEVAELHDTNIGTEKTRIYRVIRGAREKLSAAGLL